MLHKLDGFIWLAAVSVDCYSNALQHNGLGQSLPDTHTHRQIAHSYGQGNSSSNEKNSHEAGTELTNTLPSFTSEENHLWTVLAHPDCGLTHTHTVLYWNARMQSPYTHMHTKTRALKIPSLKIAGGKWEARLRLLLLLTRPA